MKVWVTKYLFTAGIEVVEAEIDEGMATERGGRNQGGMSTRYFHGADWHRSEAAALMRARDMIATKRKTISAQLKKLDELEQKLRNSMRGR